jgi:hypothetical protein
MINFKNTLRLLGMPILWMGVVQFVFGLLSLFIFRDGVSTDFFYPSLLMMISSLAISWLFSAKQTQSGHLSRCIIVFDADLDIGGVAWRYSDSVGHWG